MAAVFRGSLLVKEPSAQPWSAATASLAGGTLEVPGTAGRRGTWRVDADLVMATEGLHGVGEPSVEIELPHGAGGPASEVAVLKLTGERSALERFCGEVSRPPSADVRARRAESLSGVLVSCV